MEALKRPEITTTLPVRRADLDVNGHVNNGTYQIYFEEARLRAVTELLEKFPELKTDAGSEIRRCEMDFKGELKYPEQAIVTSEFLRDDLSWIQEITRSADKGIVTKGRFFIGPRNTASPVYYSEESYPHAVYHTIDVGWPEMNPEANVGLHTIQYYLDDARIRSGYAAGLDVDTLQKQGVGPVIFRVEIDYFDEISFPEELVIATVYQRNGKNRMIFRHDLFSRSTRKLILSSVVHGLFMDLKRKRPYQLPEEVMSGMLQVKMPSPFA